MGTSSATLTCVALAPEGSATVQVSRSTLAGAAEAKQVSTSKQPGMTSPSAAGGADIPPSPSAVTGGTSGTSEAGTVVVTQPPCEQVFPLGHVELTLPSASVCAVP